ncbi:MAG: hypothetical protein ABF969_12065 [Sporolactobacillus sp.]
MSEIKNSINIHVAQTATLENGGTISAEIKMENVPKPYSFVANNVAKSLIENLSVLFPGKPRNNE